MDEEKRLRVAWVHRALALGLACSCAFGLACGDDDGGGDRDDAGAAGNAGGGSGSGGRSDAGGGAGIAAGGSGGSSAGTGGSGGAGGAVIEDDGGLDEDAGSTDDAGALTLRDVSLELIEFDPHVGQLMHFRVVSDDDELVALGVWDPLEDGDTDIELPSSTPSGVHRLDWFADFNDNGVYNPPPADHAWRLPIAASGDASLDYTHDTDFTNIAMPALDVGEDFTFSATDMDPHVGQLFEVRVFDEDTDRLCGRYVLGEIATADFEVMLPGIVQDGRSYRVDFWADLDGDGAYDAPSTDHAWRMSGVEAGPNGLTVDFVHNTTFTDVEF